MKYFTHLYKEFITMPSLFTSFDRDEIISRIQRLNPTTKPLWGKMNVAQMLSHCQAPLKVAIGELKLKQGLIGLLFGKMAKRQLLAPEDFRHNLPTAPEFNVTGTAPEFEKERQQLILLIRQFGEKGPVASRGKHPFFGAMTEEEWDTLQWKHLDHHLRQFNA
mgnify:CR=1 FL=1